MNKYVKSFLQRGLAFGGFGPVIAGIIYLILSFSIDNFTLTGVDVFVAILSTYVLAFVHAGASIFNQIESWGIAKSLLCHLGLLYVSYLLCYIVNSWIPFEWAVIGIFSLIFIIAYLMIWLIVYISIKATSKRFNEKISK